MLVTMACIPWLHHQESGRRFGSDWDKMAPASAMLFFSLLVVWLVEQLYPARPEWTVRPFSSGMRGLGQLGRDLVYLIIGTRLTAFLIGRVEPYVNPAIDGLKLGLVSLWPTGAPFPAKVALAFLAIEFSSYWVHRAAHRFKPLWQFHSTHHVINELNGLKALRTHPVDNLVFYFGRTVPLICLGAGLDEVVAALYFGGVLGVLAHANVSVSERHLGLVLNLPRAHSVHHSTDLVESHSNFGCHTVVWDRLFGTFKSEPREPTEVGVRPVRPRTLWQELAWPFYRPVNEE